MDRTSARKIATAQERLRRIKTLIDPYSVGGGLHEGPERGEWMPGDHLLTPRQKPTPAAADKAEGGGA